MEEISPPSQSYSRHRIASVFMGLAALGLVSGMILNPWVGKFYRASYINTTDVMFTYFCWSLVAAFLIFFSALLMRRVNSKVTDQVALFVIVCMLIVMSDRFLLAWIGLPLWIADEKNHYKHRPNAVRTWGRSTDNLIRINSHGFHDDDFPLQKGVNERRGIVVGDSVAMGHALPYEKAFPNQLENLLNEMKSGDISYQIINAGVQGYATFQEYNSLADSLQFKPDFVIVQFCLNDLGEPFVVNKQFGGVGSDYHGVAQESSRLLSYLLNETGYGRLVQKIQDKSGSLEIEKKWEVYNVKDIATTPRNDPKFAENWNITLSYLDKTYELARQNDIKLVLLVSPYTFQLFDESSKEPQRTLINHGAARNVDVIDLIPVFEKLVSDENAANREKPIKRYFLDENHFTPEGHRVVASELHKFISGRNYF